MNRYIHSFIAAVLATITIVSCNDARRSETYRLLEGIDKSELTSKGLEAKYALLLSQALDKNYIDLQSDSIIAILCAIIVIYLIRKQLKIRTAEKKELEIEKKRYEQLYADAIAERDALTKMIEDSSVKDETKVVILEFHITCCFASCQHEYEPICNQKE